MRVVGHLSGDTIASLLQHAEEAEGMPLWVPQGPKSEEVCQLSQC